MQAGVVQSSGNIRWLVVRVRTARSFSRDPDRVELARTQFFEKNGFLRGVMENQVSNWDCDVRHPAPGYPCVVTFVAGCSAA